MSLLNSHNMNMKQLGLHVDHAISSGIKIPIGRFLRQCISFSHDQDDSVSDMQQHRCQDEDSAQYSLSPHQSSTDHLDVQNLNYDRIPRERVLIRTSLHVVDSTPKLKVVQKPTRFQHYIAQLTAVPAVTPLPFSKAKMETAILATDMKVLITTTCTYSLFWLK